ncbi:hypothetical protein CERZMDRAFT_80514 [Cercospora zeae-maydis SCOH1-5]|uniref:Uncharacterized protein n=1 Tax=Cercospora zeae-maydis SCOH1-5 TaxID=717836 RepID=A0A6A6FWS3_9PEZI|nr:hypothetical protein CERZMDRAFT_80514 [Cercospora zeae-maydis SCOH1-5]
MSTGRSERCEEPEDHQAETRIRHTPFATAERTSSSIDTPQTISTNLSPNVLSLRTTPDSHSIEDALASYSSRQTAFHLLPPTQICDEKVIRHDHTVAQHFESQSSQLARDLDTVNTIDHHHLPSKKTLIHHRELIGLNLISNLTRIRFERADITIKFSDAENALEGERSDPEIVDFGPKHLVTSSSGSTSSTHHGTEEKREWHLSANLPAIPLGSIPGLGFSAGISRSYEKRYASSVEAASVPSHGHVVPDTARFWIREDGKQREGLPLEFDCAVIVTYAAPASFRATVSVKAGAVFDMLAQPWSEAEPVLFQHGVELGEEIGKATMGSVDFATLDARDWGELIGADCLLEAGKR